MKFFSAALSALVVVGFAAAASACPGYQTKAQQNAEAVIVLPQDAAGS